jgi:hypothetical protein
MATFDSHLTSITAYRCINRNSPSILIFASLFHPLFGASGDADEALIVHAPYVDGFKEVF